MPNYTAAEYLEMIIMYGECGRNAKATSRLYLERFPNRDHHPNHNVILRTISRLRDTGSVLPAQVERIGAPQRVRTVRNEERVLDAIREDPGTSTRKLERNLHIPRSTINAITRADKLNPYHKIKVQKLEPGDYQLRIDFCNLILRMNNEDPNILKPILWTDESLFTREGCINLHNTHWYAVENPHATVIRNFQNKWKINMWGGIIGGAVLLYPLPENMNGEKYLVFLQEVLPELLQELPAEDQPGWFQHDGAPSHYAASVATFLNQRYPRNWFGRNGPLRWPPRSPDLTPLDFFLWGHLKESTYFDEPADQFVTMARIMATRDGITPEKLAEVRQELLVRCYLCLRQDGRQFEQLLS